ncbi:MAG: tetratricopeptide repeat protein [Chitinophagales bacterium]
MKQLLILLLVSITILSHAQKGKVIAASTALSESQLKEAKTLITEAFSDPEVEAMAKAWLVKADIYKEIYVLQMEDLLMATNSLQIADEAYKKAYELDMAAEKKPGRYKDDIKNGLFTVSRGHFEKAVGKFNAGEFENAMNGFLRSTEMIDYMDAQSLLSESDRADADVIMKDGLENAALCALNAQDYDKAADIYKNLISINVADEKVYANLASILISRGSYEEGKAIIEEGRKKYPENESLADSELNYYIGTDQSDKAIDKLLEAISAKPNNPDLYFNLALAYDKLGDKDKMIESYTKIIEMEPTYHAAYLNLGAYYNERANDVIKEMNDMTDWKEAVKLEPKRDEFYNKALPYLEKAYDLDKDNTAVKRALERIYANMNMLDKVKELKGE